MERAIGHAAVSNGPVREEVVRALVRRRRPEMDRRSMGRQTRTPLSTAWFVEYTEQTVVTIEKPLFDIGTSLCPTHRVKPASGAVTIARLTGRPMLHQTRGRHLPPKPAVIPHSAKQIAQTHLVPLSITPDAALLTA